jgi:PEP-CTERM motif
MVVKKKAFGIAVLLGLAIGLVTLSAPALADTFDTYYLVRGTGGLEAHGSFTVDVTNDTITAWDIKAAGHEFENGGGQSAALLTEPHSLEIQFSEGSNHTFLDLYVPLSTVFGAATIDLLTSPHSVLKVNGHNRELHDISVTTVPEPGSAALILAGLAVICFVVMPRKGGKDGLAA